MKRIELTKSAIALVDDRDYARLTKHSWCIDGSGYAIGWHAERIIRMHRLIMRAKKGQLVDHINRNKLDNRRRNLRFATSSQNALNSKLRNTNTSGVRGLWWNHRASRWNAMIHIQKVRTWLGAFVTKEQAILAIKRANKLRDSL